MRAPWTIPLLLAALGAIPPASLAGDALKLELVPKAMSGQGLPGLVVKAEAPLAKVAIELVRSTDGHRVAAASGSLAKGRSHRFELPLAKPGKARFRGNLSVDLKNGETGSMPIDVEVELVPPLLLTIEPADVKLSERTLTLRASRPVRRAQVSLMSDAGAPLGTTEKSWEASQPAGAPIAVSWDQSAGTILRITVQAWDEDEFFGAVELFPWRVDIPHEEVHFATGSFEIAKAETGKLEASRTLVDAAIDKYGKLATIHLYVAGHTDTVGDRASNRELSFERARAIARWFRANGARLPISFTGFGEEKLLVETPDETDEVRNRRAEYIVSVEPPALSGNVRWEAIR